MKEIKWTQWSPEEGMFRFGHSDLNTIMGWMRELGKSAYEYYKDYKPSENCHAIYGRKMYDEKWNISEVRLYCDTLMTDEELEDFIMDNPHDVLYMIHKSGVRV